MTIPYDFLISPKRQRSSSKSDRDLTTEMLSDKARIVTSTAFRRLQTKAQVFSLEKNAAVRSRLTHTLEVAMYGQLIAEKTFDLLVKGGKIEPIYRQPFVTTVENACLLHDIGNPPFGHLGEYAIRDWFKNNKKAILDIWERRGDIEQTLAYHHIRDFENFDGNAQGFHIVTRLQWLNDEYGLNLTNTLLASMIKYLTPAPSENVPDAKIGYFEIDRDVVVGVWKSLKLKLDGNQPNQKHPLAFIMEAADDIAYSVSDIEDALEKEIISQYDFFEFMQEEIKNQNINDEETKKKLKSYVRDRRKTSDRLSKNAQFINFRIDVVSKMVQSASEYFANNDILIREGGFNGHLLTSDSTAGKLSSALKDFAKKHIYNSQEAIEIELSGFKMIQDILSRFLQIMDLSPEEFLKIQKQELKRGHLSLERRLYNLLPKRHILAYNYLAKRKQNLELILRTHLIIDYLAGMTDSHAVKVFNILNGTTEGGRS